MEQMICEQVTKKYGDKEVVKNINLTLEKGKIYGLIGRNGAGKSTLINIITDNITRTSGEVLYSGSDIVEMGKSFRKIFYNLKTF